MKYHSTRKYYFYEDLIACIFANGTNYGLYNMANISGFSYYHIDDQPLFSSIDGQKFECRINTFKARYFSKEKGVSPTLFLS